MAGTYIHVETTGLTQINKALKTLVRKGQSLDPVLRDIGEYLLESTQRRFIDQQAPDGKPWAPLSPDTILKKKRPDRILVESGNLADLLRYQITNNTLQLGSHLEYAATHQFGRDEANIEARPFLGIAPFERDEVLNMVGDHLLDKL